MNVIERTTCTSLSERHSSAIVHSYQCRCFLSRSCSCILYVHILTCVCVVSLQLLSHGSCLTTFDYTRAPVFVTISKSFRSSISSQIIRRRCKRRWLTLFAWRINSVYLSLSPSCLGRWATIDQFYKFILVYWINFWRCDRDSSICFRVRMFPQTIIWYRCFVLKVRLRYDFNQFLTTQPMFSRANSSSILYNRISSDLVNL
jgi:hypothetical protein